MQPNFVRVPRIPAKKKQLYLNLANDLFSFRAKYPEFTKWLVRKKNTTVGQLTVDMVDLTTFVAEQTKLGVMCLYL